MRRLLILLALLAPALAHAAGNVTTATVTITNPNGTQPGTTLTVNGVTRTFVNSVSNPSTQILTNGAPATAATNLYAALADAPFSGVHLTFASSTAINLQSDPGVALTVTISADGTVSTATSTLTAARNLRLPITVESGPNQIAISSDLADALQYGTHAIGGTIAAMQNFVQANGNQNVAGQLHFNNPLNSYTGDGSGLVSLDPTALVGSVNDADHAGMADEATFADGIPTILPTDPGNMEIVCHKNGDHTVYASSHTQETANGLTNSIGFAGDGSRLTGILSRNVIFGQLTAPVYQSTGLANGANADVGIGNTIPVEVSGPSAAFSIAGLANYADGRIIILINRTGQNMTLLHNSGLEPTAAARLTCLTGADKTVTGNSAAILVYNGAAARWIVITFTQ